MQITIKLERLDEVISNLKGIPGAARFVIQAAAKLALNRSRTMIDRSIRHRYAIGQQAVLAAIGKPRMFPVGGRLSVSGKRFPLQYFKGKDFSPAGVRVDILNARPSRYAHAFIVEGGRRLAGGKSAPIMERDDGSGRYPIHGLLTPESVPEMLREHSQVLPEVEQKVNDIVSGEITRLMPLVLSGLVKVPGWYTK